MSADSTTPQGKQDCLLTPVRDYGPVISGPDRRRGMRVYSAQVKCQRCNNEPVRSVAAPSAATAASLLRKQSLDPCNKCAGIKKTLLDLRKGRP